MKTTSLAIAIALSGGVLLGCEERTSPDTTAASRDMRDAANDMKEAARETADATKDAAKDAADAANTKFNEMRDASATWLRDNVEAQWPAMKADLETMAGKTASITDTTAKERANTLVSELRTQAEAFDQKVAELKNASADTISAIWDSTKQAWNDFTAKMSELKTLVPA